MYHSTDAESSAHEILERDLVKAYDRRRTACGLAMLSMHLLPALRDGPVEATASEPGPMSQ